MKKKTIIFSLVGMMLIFAGGCGNKNAEIIENSTNAVTEVVQETEISSETGVEQKKQISAETETTVTEETQQATVYTGKDSLSFNDLEYLEFWFGSGAGAWSTEMTINTDGSFSGIYQDSDVGAIGEGYPNGSVYYCEFTGQFAQPVKINDYTYSMQILEMNYANEADTKEIKDGVLYKYTEAYGLYGTDEMLVYMKEAPTEELPEEFLSWVKVSGNEGEKLPFYGLYNEAKGDGFSSSNILDNARENVRAAESWTESLEKKIKTETSYRKTRSEEMYQWWDNSLNYVWGVLKRVLDEETMEALTKEELEWIDMKEKAAEEARAEAEGDYYKDVAKNLKAAELTKARVYELLELLD